MSDIQGPLNDEYDVVKTEISNFAHNCKVLIRILDEIGAAHPVIQGTSKHSTIRGSAILTGCLTCYKAGVIVFKIAVKLELDRRENDAKVTALHVAMYDMMSVLRV